MEVQVEHPPSSISEDQSTNSSQDAMRTRVRLFTEAVVKMVSPVLLALALKKVDIKGEGTWFVFVRGSISPIAAITLLFSILQLVGLWICLSKVVARLEWLQLAASKLFVHLCAILLMFLASGIMVLISNDYKFCVIVVPPLVGFIIYFLRKLRSDEVHDGAMDAMASCAGELENSVDFSSAFTALLFLGLERLALEVQQNSGGVHQSHLESSLALSFATCVLGVAIMLIWTIAPPSMHDKVILVMVIEASNVVLAVLIVVIVFWITLAQVEWYAGYVVVPPLISSLFWVFKKLIFLGDRDQPREDNDSHQEQLQGDQANGQVPRLDLENGQPQGNQRLQDQQDGVQPPQDDAKAGDEEPIGHGSIQAGDQHPTGNQQQVQESSTDDPLTSHTPDASNAKAPSLELTKFAFVGFLTVSIPSIGKSNCSGSFCFWTDAFILLTAMCVVSALVWRLLGHRSNPSPAHVLAANIVSSSAHVLAIAALIPLMVIAEMTA